MSFIVTIRVLARLIDGMMYRTLHIGDDITRGLVMQSAVKHLIMKNLKTTNKTKPNEKDIAIDSVFSCYSNIECADAKECLG